MLSLYVQMMSQLKSFSDERGAVASEYAVLLALIAAAMVIAVTALGTNITGVITDTAAEIN